MSAPFTIPVDDGPMPAWLDRLVAATFVIAAALCTWKLLGATPDPRGYDTHVQLGLSPCGWPRAYGMPCPTCGATTAACLLVHGRPIQALITQPFGAAVALAGLLSGGFAAFCLARRRSMFDVIARIRWSFVVVGGVALLLLSWAYKYLTFVP